MRRKRRRNRIIAGLIILLLLVAGWFSFGPQTSGPTNKVITVGVVSQSKADAAIWHQVAKTAAARYGLKIQIKNFTDYNQPNKALKNGDIDLNAFQHYAFLQAWNKANGGGIAAIGKTYIAPIRLYSKKYQHLSDLPAGASIAIPNDATNESRALFVLKNAGLITLRPGKKLVTVADIKTNPHHFQFKEVSAEQTGRVIKSVAAAVVNNDYAGPANLGAKETIYTEPVNKDSAIWMNLIAARSDQKHKRSYQEVVKAYQTEAVSRLMRHYYGRKQLPAWQFNLK